jgi:ABC-type lipoprotein release transport system permease subunit
VLVFLFGGPRLYPTFGVSHLIVGLVAVIFVSLASTLYPARIAAKVQPIVAMSPRE